MKKLHILLAAAFIFLIVALPSFAQSQKASEITTLPLNETVNRDYFAGNERVVVSGTVNGDVYLAGGDVIFDGTTSNDLMSVGGNVTISGLVEGDVRVAGGNVTFSGAEISGNLTIAGGDVVVDQATNIAGSVVAVGGNLQFMGPVGDNLVFAGGNVTVGNNVNGDIWSPGVGTLRLMNGALVNGQMTYTSSEEAVVSEGATVIGTTERRAPPVEKEDAQKSAGMGVAGIAGIMLFFFLGDIILSLLLGIALVFFLPNFVIRVSEKALSSIGTSFLIGLVVAIVTPVALILFMLTLIGIPLSIMLFAVFFLVLWFAKVLGSIALGRRILKTKKTESSYKAMFLGIIAYFIIGIVPLVGGLLQAFLVITGLGSIAINKKEYYKELRSKKVL